MLRSLLQPSALLVFTFDWEKGKISADKINLQINLSSLQTSIEGMIGMISRQENTDNRQQSTRKVNLNIVHQMMNRKASLNVCQTARLYIHLIVPEGRTAVSAAIQDGSLLP